jgi:hypothetical protein
VTEQGILPGLWPIQGDGVLARQGDLVLLIHPAGGPLTDRLLSLLADAARAGQSGLRFTELVSAEFDADAAAPESAADQHGSAVVAFGPVGGGTAVAVYGTGWADVTTAYGTQRLTTGEPYGRLRCVLPSTLIKVSAGVQPVPGESQTDPYLRLADGVVRAVGLVYAPAQIRADAPGGAQPAVADRGGAPEVSPAAPAASGPPVPSLEVQEPVREELQQAASAPFPELVEEPEPEYHATQVERAIPAPYAPPAPDPYAPPAPDPYAQQLPDPFAPPAPQQVPDQYAPPAPPEVPGPADGGAARPDFIAVPLAPGLPGGEVPQRDPLPLGAEPPEAKDLGLVEMPSEMVEGVYCKNEHFNDPEARYCAVCGISMGQVTRVRQQGKRPPLGVLILGDGSVCQVDADYVIGREPTLDSAVAEGRARPLRLMGASGVVSRIHARVELDGWQVFVTDLKSANGTQLLLPGERNPTSLQPGVRTPLVAGTQIRLGGEYGLQYDSHRHR